MKKRGKIYILFIIIVCLILILLKFNRVIDFVIIENFILELGIFAPLFYTLVYIILALFGFSTAIMTISAGILFSPIIAFVTVTFSATIASSIAFFIGRKFYYLTNYFRKSKSKTVKKIFNEIKDESKEHGFLTILNLRMLFVPYILLSYVSGTLKEMKFIDFILATILTNAFTIVVYVFLGFSITHNIIYFIIAIILVILMNVGIRVYMRKRKK